MIRTPNRRRRWGFTKVEVVVVLFCLFIVISLFMPAVTSTKGAATAKGQSLNNLKQIALACHAAAGSFHNLMPPAFGDYPIILPINSDDAPTGSLFYHILPYIEEEAVYNELKKSGNTTVGNRVVRTYLAPLDPSIDGTTNNVCYSSNYAVFGTAGAKLPQTFLKGTSNTILIAEKFSRAGLVPDGFTPPPQPNAMNFSAPPVTFTWNDNAYSLPGEGGKGPFYNYPGSFTPECVNPVYSSLDFTLPSTAPQGKTPSQFTQSSSDALACSVQGFEQVGCNVAMGDASVRTVSPTMLVATFNWAGNPVGPTAPPSDW